jgi:glutaconyl-CoA/methylmalonyl-CoA decarboxylase subunit gamma
VRYFVTFPGGSEVAVDLVHLPSGETRVSIDGTTLDADTVAVAGAISTRIHGQVVDLWMEGSPPEVGIVAGGRRFYARVESERMRAVSAALAAKGSGDAVVISPMPGRVLKVLVKVGDEIEVGQPVVVVEAMKMENELTSGKSGRVSRVLVTAGETVEGRARLVEIA